MERGRNGQGDTGILVVEDERIVARDLANTLTDLGYSVVAMAATGEDAIKKARELAPRLVLMDIRLAGPMDGVQAAEAITSERGIPVIYLSAHADHDTLDRAKCTDPFGYLVKPFKAIELRCAIEIALHKHAVDTRLREREKWLETTLRSIGDGVIATDPARRIEFMNPIAQALTGWGKDSALGRPLDDVVVLIAEKDRARLPSPLARALAADREETPGRDRDRERDMLLVARDGEVTPVEASVAPIRTDEGKLLGGVMVLRDLTERREAAQEIARLESEFEHRLVERTSQLEAANDELEAFSYSVAHDLRAPLSGIDGFSQVLIEEHSADLGPSGVDHLARVRKAAQRMGRLIEDLLRLSRVAKADFHCEWVNLSFVVQSVVADLRIAHPHRKVTVDIAEGVHVHGNESLLQIMLENLFGNAWKFTAAASAPQIEFGAMDQDGERICFVRDNGVGFDMTHSDKLFTPFQRFHSRSEYEGSGIGLTIVRRIINRHDGRIWAESSPGHGTTFYFVI